MALSLDNLVQSHSVSYFKQYNLVILGLNSVESWPKNPEFKNNPENFHSCMKKITKQAVSEFMTWQESN